MASIKSEKANSKDPRRIVHIRLFKDTGRYRDPLFVSVNNYRAAIPRGVDVGIPYYVYKHIQEMTAQDEATAAMITIRTAEFDAKAKAMGL